MFKSEYDGNDLNYTHYFLCYYISRNDGPDWLSTSLLNFKDGRSNTVAGWTDCAVKELETLALDETTTIIRALGSGEINIPAGSDKPLDRLCLAISAKYHCPYITDLLFKMRPTQPMHTIQGVNNRLSELDGMFQINPAATITPGQSILLVDDLLTTGLTAIKIFKAIRTVYPQVKLTLFTLAKVDFNPDINKLLVLKGDKYQWERVKWVDV